MPTTPNRGWTYPSFEQNPYFETIEDFFLAQDADVHALMTGALLDGGSNGMLVRTALTTTVARTLTAGAGVLITNGTGVSANPIIAATTPELRTLIADSASIANTTTPAAFDKKVTLPAGILNTVGALLLVLAFGNVTDTGTPNLQLMVRLDPAGGGNLFNVTGPLPTLSGTRTWGILSSAVIRSTGASGIVKSGFGMFVVVEGPPVLQGNSETGTFTTNLTAARDIDVVAIWGTASPSNTINLTSLVALALPIVGGTTS
jgi:hypothetical protein